MSPKKNSPLHYKRGTLHFDNIPLSRIADKVPTPFYLYSERTLLDNYWRFHDAAVAHHINSPLVCFALKANPHLPLLRSLAKAGAGADIVSAGELKLALSAGIPASKIVFSGVGKTDAELESGIRAGIQSFNVESLEELAAINKIAAKLKKRARVAFRLNPQVHAKTHKHISTGFKNHKFGILAQDILKASRSAHYWKNVDLVGLSIHIGSQLTCLKATKRALKELAQLALDLNHPLEFLDVGGGLGVDYSPADELNFSSIEEYMALVSETLQRFFYKKSPHRPRVIFEPGRVISARAGAFVTRVVRTKQSAESYFAIVDGGMNDFVRTSLYGAYHEIYPFRAKKGPLRSTHVVGPICETADCFAEGRMLALLKSGDLISVADVGAYGYSMASRYNARELPPQVVVTKRGSLKISRD